MIILFQVIIFIRFKICFFNKIIIIFIWPKDCNQRCNGGVCGTRWNTGWIKIHEGNTRKQYPNYGNTCASNYILGYHWFQVSNSPLSSDWSDCQWNTLYVSPCSSLFVYMGISCEVCKHGWCFGKQSVHAP